MLKSPLGIAMCLLALALIVYFSAALGFSVWTVGLITFVIFVYIWAIVLLLRDDGK